MNIKRNIIITMSFVVAIMLVIGFSYAIFIKKEIVGNRSQNVIMGNTISASELNPSFIVTYDDGDNSIDTSEVTSNYQELIKFKLSTIYNSNQNIIIELNSVINNSNGTYNLYNCSQLNYNSATYGNVSSNCTRISGASVLLPVEGKSNKIHTATYLTLNAASTNYYVLTIDTLATYNSFKGFILVKNYIPNLLKDAILIAHPPVSDATSSTYVTSASGINFGSPNSLTNGQGLYLNVKNNEGGNISYFRGGTFCAYTSYASENTSGTRCTGAGGTWSNYHCSLDDSKSTCESKGFTYYELKNNVMFGGFAWKIVRINADGSISLLYNGTSPIAKGANSTLGVVVFNTTLTSSDYVGYVYGTTNSTIKGVVDTWYSNNLSSYTSKLIDTGLCGDRSGTTTAYGANLRLSAYKPSYSCPIPTNDLYTTSTSRIGNKKLTYPIGLITADEVVYAGSALGSTNNFISYMHNGTYYWTMSPSYYNSSYPVVYATFFYGYLTSSYVSQGSLHARPVITIKPGILVTSGTGTLDDPWIVQ